MIPLTTFNNKNIAILGLGSSGLAAASALIAGGSKVFAFDDNPSVCEQAKRLDLTIQDLRQINWRQMDALLLTPGVPLTHPEPHWSVTLANSYGVHILGDIELMELERRKRGTDVSLVAITGTNGKSTTSSLIAHILKTSSRNVQLGGNIGKPALSLKDFYPRMHYVIEVSSFQSDLTTNLSPCIGAITNITSDHLDRHGTMDAYASMKKKVISRAGVAVVGVDDIFSAEIAKQSGRVIQVSTSQTLADGHYATGPLIMSRSSGGQPTIEGDLTGIRSLRGRHNAQNAVCAVAIAKTLGLEHEEVLSGLKSFPGLPHRMEEVGHLGSTVWINDSKATNAAATAQALSCFENVHCILGGKTKSDGITSLAPMFPKIVKAYLIGEATDTFAHTLTEKKVPFERCETLDRALLLASRNATTSTNSATVLLSPACASYDQFENFEDRGNQFRSLVHDLIPLMRRDGRSN